MAPGALTVISRPLPLFAASALLRLGMLVYGQWQDANSPVKYTDIDYLVFTDAARFTFTSTTTTTNGSPSSTNTVINGSPYTRETYRYTPLLAWLMWSTTLGSPFWFATGKLLFAAADLLAGWLLIKILRLPSQQKCRQPMPLDRACRLASIWLLNPMVATISTRGSAEGLLGALVTALLWAVLTRRPVLSGLLLGLGVHFKIYPFIYAPAVVWWMDRERMGGSREKRDTTFLERILNFVTLARIKLTIVSLSTFTLLNLVMYALYEMPFVNNTFLHHVTRIDHRHNFSPYNIQLYKSSHTSTSFGFTGKSVTSTTVTGLNYVGPGIESLAFLPQLLLSTILIPFVGAKKDLATTMMAQTFAFVTFNKVCTSQYFLWYMIFLPLYLPCSSLVQHPRRGIVALALWIAAQAAWLHQGYALEFLGLSTFVPGLWAASLAFFLVNCWILGIIIEDLARF
ncbi:glycosyltransferase family 50 protein [Xylariomycetidae sp. FL0641]|nr:glycosyltransferase family 50 protein [Xylariomycetidae sp. FL0641]